MRRIYLLLLFLFPASGYTQAPKIYLNLNSHNEVTMEPYDGGTPMYYKERYDSLVRIANKVNAVQGKWNFQSDVRFLLGCLQWDPDTLSGNKNLLKWMDDSPFIECDPHSHEGNHLGVQWNYSDVAHLHDSLGVTNRKNVGGFKVDGMQNGSNWEAFESGMQGIQYPTNIWQPNVLWGGSYSGGGTHNDMNTYGCWKPDSMSNYGAHDPGKRVRLQGNGCSLHLTDTTDEASIMQDFRTFVNRVQSGQYPAGEFYTQSVQFDCKWLTSAGYMQNLLDLIDSLDAIVGEGAVVWATLSEKDSIWLADFGGAQKRLDCDSLVVGSEPEMEAGSIRVFPNPAFGQFNLEVKQAGGRFTLTDLQGRNIFSSEILSSATRFSTSDLPAGLYVWRYSLGGETRFGKLWMGN